MINPPNLLLLDEPTTHLDVDAVDALIKALNQYEGTIVFISHDIHFVRSIANVVFEVKGGRVRKIPGNFDYYLEKKAKGEIPIEEPPTKSKTLEPVHKIDLEKLRLQEGKKQRKEQQNKRNVHNIEIRREIQKLKAKREKLHLEKYAKTRVLSGPRIHFRDEESIKEYKRRIKEIEQLIAQIDNNLKELESKFI